MSNEDSTRPTLPAAPDHTLITEVLSRLPVLPRPSYRPRFEGHKRVLDLASLHACAHRRNLHHVELSPFIRLFHDQRRALIFYKNMTAALLYLDRTVTNRKPITKAILEAAGLPTAAGRTVHHHDTLSQALEALPFPMVVKPVTGSGGRGVSTHLQDLTAVTEAAAPLLATGTSVLVEEHVRGVDLRLTVVAGQVVGAALRVPANVLADGTATIEELVRVKNLERAENDYTKHHPLTLGARERGFLARQSLEPGTVPPAGRRVFLHGIANISAGGDNYEVLPYLHPTLCRIAERAAGLFRSSLHAGIDMIVEGLDVPASRQRVVLCEVNLNNELPMHLYPVLGSPSAVDEAEFQQHWHSSEPLLFSHWNRHAAPLKVPVDIPALADLAGSALPEDRSSSLDHGRPTLTEADQAPTSAPRPAALEARLLESALRDSSPTGTAVEFSRDGRLAFTSDSDGVWAREVTGCTLLAAAVGSNAELTATVAQQCGIPAMSRRSFTRTTPQELYAWTAPRSSAWEVRYTNAEGQRRRLRLHPGDNAPPSDLPERFDVTISESPIDPACVVLMAGDEVVQTQILEPLAIVGDGATSVSGLVAQEVSRRTANPALRPYARALRADDLLSAARLGPSTVPAAGVRITVGRSPRLSDGGAPIGSGTTLPSQELGELAQRFQRALGTSGVAAVTFAPSHAAPSSAPMWALWRYSTRPNLMQWRFPLRGPSFDPFAMVAQRILAGRARAVRLKTA